LAAVGEVDDDLVGALDHVIVGDNQARRVDDEARAERAYFARQAVLLLVIEEIVEEFLEGRALRAGTVGSALGRAFERLCGGDVDDGVLQAFGDVGDGVGTVREAFGGEQRGSGEEQSDPRRHEAKAPKAYGLRAALWHRSRLPHRVPIIAEI